MSHPKVMRPSFKFTKDSSRPNFVLLALIIDNIRQLAVPICALVFTIF